MGQAFDEKKYPLINIILNSSLLLGKKLKNREIQNLIYEECVNELMWRLPDTNDIRYFDFNLKINKFVDDIKIVPSNILTALWFIGEYPINSGEILKKKKYISPKYTYKFDGRSKTLKIT